MYVTRPLSMYRTSPEAAHMPPPEGPNSGHLVVFDEESEAEATFCWGVFEDRRIRELPFPQNEILNVRYTESHASANQNHSQSTTYSDKVLLIPVMDQPLSSNRYYVIRAEGKHKGQACSCSREEDMGTCCFCLYIRDLKPMPLDHRNIYHQVEIIQRSSGRFVAKSVAPDGFPPRFLRRKKWKLYISRTTPPNCQLGEANGVNVALRRRLPEFNFRISDKRSPAVIVGKWYCPFVFIKEEIRLKDQMTKSMYYPMALEQFWEEIHTSENDGLHGNLVVVNTSVQREIVRISGQEAMLEDPDVADGMRLFTTLQHQGQAGLRVGLSSAITERMRWEEVRGGWMEGKEGQATVERVEEFGGVESGWKRFGCYMLVERFVLRRLDGSVVITFDFRHTNRIQCKWE